ncbi:MULTISPECIES: hypothetical protein [Cyanophyceae]|nr:MULTISPECIES: hypothetical protein [unclassified Trichocoleus]
MPVFFYCASINLARWLFFGRVRVEERSQRVAAKVRQLNIGPDTL